MFSQICFSPFEWLSYLPEWQSNTEWETDFPCTGSLPTWLQQPKAPFRDPAQEGGAQVLGPSTAAFPAR